MGRLIKKIAVLCLLGFTFLLFGCNGGVSKESGRDKDLGNLQQSERIYTEENKVKQKEAVDTELIYAKERDTRWNEGVAVTNQDVGRKIDVNIRAQIIVPEVSSMSVGEFEGLNTSIQKVDKNDETDYGDYRLIIADWEREKIVKAILRGEIYPFYYPVLHRSWKGRIGKTQVKDGAFTEDAYVGKWDGTEYIIEFRKGGFICIEPLRYEDVEPEEVMAAQKPVYALSYNSGESEPGAEDSYVNNCNISKEEALNTAENFLVSLGYAGQILTNIYTLQWCVADSLESEAIDEADTQYGNGYVFEFQAGMGGLVFSTFGTEKDFYRQLTFSPSSKDDYSEEHCYHDYSLENKVYIYVTERGVIKVELWSPLKLISETENVKLLSMESVKETIKSSMEEYINLYLAHARTLGDTSLNDVDHLDFTELELVYCRVRSEEKENHFSYVPAWRLTNWNKSIPLMMVVNAIDGSLIDMWDGLL